MIIGNIDIGNSVDFGFSRIYNASCLDENYEIAYERTWVEV